MNRNYLLCLGLCVLILGCSKKEDTSATPPAQLAASAAPDKTTAKPQVLDTIATNSQAAINSLASNATTSAAAVVASATNIAPAANTALQNARSALSGLTQPSAPPATPVPASLNALSTPSVSTPAAPPVSAPSTPDTGVPSLASLSTDQLTGGLKEALANGLKHAVSSLGQPGGFLNNVNVKIPLPEKIQTVEKTLRAIGQGQLADQCITTMNQAAEQAVPAAADVFVASLKNMSVDDAKGILAGAPDAATQYFRHNTESELTKKFQPIVQQAMTKCGATAAYQQVLDKAKSASPFFSNPSLDLNAYVTGKTMDGLFKMVAEEEKSIRNNPLARNTDLLKSVFGALQK